jgi:hypothetical protein
LKYAVITPTFEPHFQFIEKYLESYKEFVIDKENITLLFTISKDEEDAFKKITDKYCEDVKFETLFFEDILKHFGISLSPDELLKKYKKFTFQTLKKFYTMLYSDADRFLVLDSESIWAKETNMKDLFEKFFESPFIASSSISCRNSISDFTQGVNDNVNFLLDKSCDRWFLENFVWFYDKAILNDMFQCCGYPIEMADKVYGLHDEQKIESGIFEIELYQAYLYHNNNKYNYTVIDIDKLLESKLNRSLLRKYLDDYNNLFNGNCGILEHTMLLLTESNWETLANMFKTYNFNIIRCDYSDFENIELQEKFMGIVKPNILAASQEHAFGINDKYKILVDKNKYFQKMEKHLSRLLHPQKFLPQLFIEPFSIIYYYIMNILYKQKNIKKYEKLYGNKK